MAIGSVLAISKQDKDKVFGRQLAGMNTMNFVSSTDPKKIREYLVDNPQTVVLWDGESPELVQATEETLIKYSAPKKVFVVTNGPVNEYQHVVQTRAFGHHFYRRYANPAPMICSKLISAALTPFPFGILRFFPRGTKSQKIELRRSVQKVAAVGAIQNYMQKIEVTSRLAALVAQAADELLMNAIYDAPVTNGHPTRKNIDRNSDFDLTDRDVVELEVATAESYVGIGVGDNYGSIRKEVVHHFLGLDFADKAYVPREGQGAGLGLHGIIQAGLSVIFVAKPGFRTEVMIFFPNVSNFKDFRTGFRFLSILSD